jgi:spore coat protein H
VRTIENKLELSISNRDFSRIKKVKGKHVYLENQNVNFNGEHFFAKEIHTRGQTSHYFRRKSFAITLDKKTGISHNGETEKFKHFNALNLVWDKCYIGNRLAFGLMKKIQLSGLYYAYGQIEINESSEGVYLFMERPQDWALKKHQSPFIIRRGYDHRVDKLKTIHHLDSGLRQRYLEDYQSIYELIKDDSGKQLYEKLSKYLDVEMYMKWLAFNYLVSNGDYTDEIYLYIDKKEDRFKLIPWDYDDIFSSEPHEGLDMVDPALKNKYIFSSEDPLDVKIAADEYLYALYLEQLKKILDQLTPEIIKLELELIYSELYPYYSDREIISMSKYDWHEHANIEKLKNELSYIYASLTGLRSEILGKISDQPKIIKDEK